MRPTGAGGSKDLTETDGVEVTIDIDHFDEINIDVKLEGESDDTWNTKYRMVRVHTKSKNVKRKNYFD